MYTDIFEAARSTADEPTPVVTALLYSFCPAAAHWYVRGIPPEVVFDVVWRALEDYATGKSLAECLQAYGLDVLIPDVKNYIEEITAFRSRYSGFGAAPELLPIFTGGRARRSVFGLRKELNHLGGSWKRVLSYARVWAFLMRDWKYEMKVPLGEKAVRTFQKFIVSLSVPGLPASSNAHFPVWGWHVTVGKVQGVYLGLFISAQRQDALRFALVYNSEPDGNKGWPGQRPYLFGLDRDRGTADPIHLALEHNDVLRMVLKMDEAARRGPNFPLAALRDRDKCLSCGYRKACYGEKGKLVMSDVVEQFLQEEPNANSPAETPRGK
jgi:hypothetical protein